MIEETETDDISLRVTYVCYMCHVRSLHVLRELIALLHV